MSDKSRYAIKRFPDLAAAIKQHGFDNRVFQGLCEDYGEAVETLRRWETSVGTRASERADACRALIADTKRVLRSELKRQIDGRR